MPGRRCLLAWLRRPGYFPSMKLVGKANRLALGLALGLAVAGPTAAQNRLYVLEPDGNYHPVIRVDQTRPFIMGPGRPVPAQGDRLALRKVEEFLPLCLTVLEQQAGATALVPVIYGQLGALEINRSQLGAIEINHEFHYSAKFVSSQPLEDVFLLLELAGTSAAKPCFLVQEIGRLEPWVARAVTVNLSLQEKLGEGGFRLHVFAGGSEVFTTNMPDAEREAALDRMVAKRIAGVQNASPRPFYGEPPKVPAAMPPGGEKGLVVLTLELSARGKVVEARVERATHPAFGEAALAAARTWRFLPKVERGKAVGTIANMPIDFGAP